MVTSWQLLSLLAVGAAHAQQTTPTGNPAPTHSTLDGPVVAASPEAATTSLAGIPVFKIKTTALTSPTKTASASKTSLPACVKVQHDGVQGNAQRAAAVKDAYQYLWDAYEKYALPMDELLPLSLAGTNDWYGWGVTVVDGIDTAIVMDLRDIVSKQLDFIQKIDFTTTQYGNVEIFDTNIRYVGGLLSAYDLLKSGQFYNDYGEEKIEGLLKQAVTLADKIAYGFNTPSGIQAGNVDFSTNQPVEGTITIDGTTYNTTNTASFGTFVLEWFRLSDLTGNNTYRYLTERAERWAIDPYPAPIYPGLVGTQFDTTTGNMLTFDGGWHSAVDSYLEYLIKTYQYEKSDTTTQYKDAWLNAVQSTKEHLAVHPYGWPGLTFLTEMDTNGTFTYSADDFSNFAGGNFLLGGTLLDMPGITQMGVDVTDGAHVLYNRSATGLGPIGWQWFNDKNKGYTVQDDRDVAAHKNNNHRGFFIPSGDEGWEFRPEEIESIFYAHRITGDPIWADYQWEIFQAVNAVSKTNQAYASVNNVDEPFGGTLGDIVDSFMFAEVLKYFYLTFSDPDVINLENWVLNTECHPLRVQCGTSGKLA